MSSGGGNIFDWGGARYEDIDKFVRMTLGMSVKISAPAGYHRLSGRFRSRSSRRQVGLMLTSAENEGEQRCRRRIKKSAKKSGEKGSRVF